MFGRPASLCDSLASRLSCWGSRTKTLALGMHVLIHSAVQRGALNSELYCEMYGKVCGSINTFSAFFF